MWNIELVHEPYPAGLTRQFGSIIASPGIAEKGYIDVLVEVTAPGGHSSIPPSHTVISCFQYLDHPDLRVIEHRNSLRPSRTLRGTSLQSQHCQFLRSYHVYDYHLRPFFREEMNPSMILCNASPNMRNLSLLTCAQSSNVLHTRRRPSVLSRPSFGKIRSSTA